MPKYRALKYREVITALKNLGFKQESGTGSSHQTWLLAKDKTHYAVTVAFHGGNEEFKPKTLASIIRQSGFSKELFYVALKK